MDIRHAGRSFALLAVAAVLAGAIGSAAKAAAPPPRIYSIEPVAAPAGGKVTIVGFGFTSRNTVRVGRRLIRDVPIAWQAGVSCVMNQPACHSGINQGLSVTMPSGLAAGSRRVLVENANGVSNTVTISIQNE